MEKEEHFEFSQNLGGGNDMGIRFSLQAEIFQHQRFLQQILRARDDLAFAGERGGALLVPSEGEALVEAGGFLAFEFADVPVCLSRFNFIEAAFVRILDGHKHHVVRPTEVKEDLPECFWRIAGGTNFPDVTDCSDSVRIMPGLHDSG